MNPLAHLFSFGRVMGKRVAPLAHLSLSLSRSIALYLSLSLSLSPSLSCLLACLGHELPKEPWPGGLPPWFASLSLSLSLSLPALGFRAVRAHPPARERAAAVRCAERIFLVGGYPPPGSA